MADFLRDYQISLEPLRGQLNYNQWTKDFQAVAQMKGLWKYFTGGGPNVIHPSNLTHEEKKHPGEFSTCFRCDTEMKAWLDEQIKIQQAVGLLRYCVEPDLRYVLPVSIADPQEAWNLIEVCYKPQGKYRLELAEARMKAIHFDQFTDISTYLNRVNQIWHDIKAAGGNFSGMDFALKLNQEFPIELGNELQFFNNIPRGVPPNLKELTCRLLAAELSIKAQQRRPAGRR